MPIRWCRNQTTATVLTVEKPVKVIQRKDAMKMDHLQAVKRTLTAMMHRAHRQELSDSPKNATAPSSRKYVPPLIGLALHLLALAATFGSTAHMLHFLVSRHLAVNAETAATLALLAILAKLGLCIIATISLSVLVLRSAIETWHDANKRMYLEWHSDNTVALTHIGPNEPNGDIAKINETPDLVCQPVKGGYNTHFCLVLALRDLSPKQTNGKIRRLVLARDAMNGEAFRLLRLWMQLDGYRSPGGHGIDQKS